MNKNNMGEIIEKLLSVPDDNPFLEGNDRIVTDIDAYFKNPSDESLLEVLETIRTRMNENGHLLIPVNENRIGTQKGMLFRTLEMKNNTNWLPLFTSREETKKGPESEFTSYFIYQALRDCLNSDVDGVIINPWGESFALSKDLIQMIFQANDEDPKSVVGKKLKRSDLADGTLLEDAIKKYTAKQTMPFLEILLRLLRDSYVYIPCTAVMGEQDQAAVEQMIRFSEEHRGEAATLKGQKFTNEEDIRFIPDILHDGEEYFFPVFTSVKEMGEYGEHFSKIGEHIQNVLPLAENSEKNVVGLILNPFTDACVIHKDLFKMIKDN